METCFPIQRAAAQGDRVDSSLIRTFPLEHSWPTCSLPPLRYRWCCSAWEGGSRTIDLISNAKMLNFAKPPAWVTLSVFYHVWPSHRLRMEKTLSCIPSWLFQSHSGGKVSRISGGGVITISWAKEMLCQCAEGTRTPPDQTMRRKLYIIVTISH